MGVRKNALKHGETCNRIRSTEYRAYEAAKRRCNSPRSTKYPDYGGRGIRFCFANFPDFLAEVGRKPDPSYSLNRIDNDGNYERGNVEWASDAKQRRNKRPRRVFPPHGEHGRFVKCS